MNLNPANQSSRRALRHLNCSNFMGADDEEPRAAAVMSVQWRGTWGSRRGAAARRPALASVGGRVVGQRSALASTGGGAAGASACTCVQRKRTGSLHAPTEEERRAATAIRASVCGAAEKERRTGRRPWPLRWRR